MDSQVIEVAIGVAVAFFFVALIASGVVELGARLLSKRAKDLESSIGGLLGGIDVLAEFKETSIYKALQVGSGGGSQNDAQPSYMSARAFADGAIEMLSKVSADVTGDQAQLTAALKTSPLGGRLVAIEAETHGDLIAAKAQLEAWFDDTMQRLQGAYTRWAKLWLAVAGLAIAAGLNVSATQVASRLWSDPVVRQAVVSAAQTLGSDTTTTTTDPEATSDSEDSSPSSQAPTETGNSTDESATRTSTADTSGATSATSPDVPIPTAAKTATDLAGVEGQIDQLNATRLPIGWGSHPRTIGGWSILVLGWFVTAFAAMLGAPFWFDLIRRLTSVAGVSADIRPALSSRDPQAASAIVALRATAPASTPQGTPDIFGTTFVPTVPRPKAP
ncbi:MAG: hypothetical protein JWM34_1078 [Ilumatobacteraceae bacterium]|nr:hypothetical protein [Ilumatobacteraceae bacterium]